MNIGIIGSGGREHAICISISKSKRAIKIYCFPGNAGTEKIAENININISNFDEIKEQVKNKKIDLLIVGPEKPLVNGIVDFFKKDEAILAIKFVLSLRIKIFTKKYMKNTNNRKIWFLKINLMQIIILKNVIFHLL